MTVPSPAGQGPPAPERRAQQEEEGEGPPPLDDAGVRLVGEMAVLLGRADDFTTALQATLDHVCKATGWAYGEAWVPDDEGELACSPAWHEGKPGLQKFRSLSTKMRFARTEGLPGELWETKRPLWREDMLSVPGLRRNAAAQAAGLRTLVAVPVLDGGRSVADLVFMHTQWRPEDLRWVAAVEAVATQLGSAMGRRRTEDRLRRQVRLLSAEQDSNPVPAVTTALDGTVLSANRAFLELAQARLRPGQVADARGEVPFRDRLENPERLLEFARLVCESHEPTVRLQGRTFRRVCAALHDENDLHIGHTWYFPELPGGVEPGAGQGV